MSAATNMRKAAQLGMPFATAGSRLRKMILFRYMQRIGDDICHRCGQRIAQLEDVSIEHKEPWLDIDAALFWDLDNIAFSHRKCNRPHSLRGGNQTQRKEGPPGTAWCGKCQAFLPLENFGKNAARWNGVRDICKLCNMRSRRKPRLKTEKNCRYRGVSSDAEEFAPKRRQCRRCYNESRRLIMRERRRSA